MPRLVAAARLRPLSSSASATGVTRFLSFLLAFGALGPPALLSQAPSASLEKRVAAARKHADAAAPGTPGASAVAAELGEIGSEYLARGDAGRSIELLEEAYGWDPENGLLLAQLTLAYVRAENFPFARFYLELAEERAPRAPPRAYAVLGDVYYSLNRLEDAVLAWEQFQRLGGDDPGILRRLARAYEELSLSSRQSYREAGDFVFYYDKAIPPETVQRAGERLERALRELTEFFGAAPPLPQTVILYEGRSYFSLVSTPDWVSGVFDGKIRVTVDPGGAWTPALEMVLVHELAHACLREASGSRAPAWLHEGLAQWFEGRRVLPGELRQAFAQRRVHSFPEMDAGLVAKSDRELARTAYLEALGLIEYLMQERGPGAIACLVRDLSDGESPESALHREAGLEPFGLLENWKALAGLQRPPAPRSR